MLRTVLCLLALTTPAFAQGNAELCRVSAQIAGSAVAERSSGASQEESIIGITADLTETEVAYAAAVQPIVAWVYTLPEDQLTGDVARLYEEACRAQ